MSTRLKTSPTLVSVNRGINFVTNFTKRNCLQEWIHRNEYFIRFWFEKNLLASFHLFLAMTTSFRSNMTDEWGTHKYFSAGYIAYGVVMFCILVLGFVGNTLTVLVLTKREHRWRGVTPLMINLAVADLLIIIFGYPTQVHANFTADGIPDDSHCNIRGFINGIVGITCIFTLTEMGVVSYSGLRRVSGNLRLSSYQVACLIGASWCYGALCMLPPLLGWSKFVISASKLSCSPNWSGQTTADKAYTLLLVTFGFFAPLTVMIISYYKTFW